MVANLANTNGKVAMAFVGNRKDIWHRMGQSADSAMTAEDAIIRGGLDYEVGKREIYRADGSIIPKSVEIYRGDNNATLAIMGENFQVVQQRDMFRFADSIIGNLNGAHYDTVGAVGAGERVWMLARIPSADFSVAGVDPHQSYILFANSHDGSLAVTGKITTVRVVCQNTLSAALADTANKALRIKHTVNCAMRMDEAALYAQAAIRSTKMLQERLDLLAKRKLTKKSFTAILDKLFPGDATRSENTKIQVAGIFENNDNNAFPEFRGTAVNLLNAITEYTDHVRGVRMTNGRAGMSENVARAEGASFGSGNTFKENALETIIELTNGAQEIKKIYSQAPGRSSKLEEMVDFG